MITITTSGSSIVFEFDDNQHYLQNGTIEVPVNSLMLVTDDSGMFTFKKSSTNDIFLSGLYTEIGMTKDELIAFYKENMVGEQGGGSSSGITSGEVQTMIDESISGKADSSAVTEDIAAAVSGKLDTSVFEAYSGSVETALSGKQDTLSAGTGISIVDNVISATGGGGMDDNTQRLIATSLVDLNDRKIDTSDVKANYQKKGDYATKSELATKANASEVMTLAKATENEKVTASALNNLNYKFGGLSLVKITESEYALTTKDENVLYIVVAD